MDIFERMKDGELIKVDDPEYIKVYEAILRATKITAELNSSYHDKDEIREIMSRLTKSEINETTWIMTPFYTDFGQFIELGENVFINHGCTFMDRGGIVIEDDVLIGPKVNLITENHSEELELRQHVYGNAITIKKGAWIGAAATILPGVTIGENSIVGAGAVVTSDVLPNTKVAGVPAKTMNK
ncbi:MAG: sugar O-acetyltransferase [Methanobrevibacter arboriphilus]|uniref:Sugar O-acetyltransferase n=1 Tax=Methanobrevibacter arboriphilus TaxID=39441 RepID=A0A843AM72_METAZ|nr:sugar O-acetyltransferase [Methanobrevibacter arboriphilus]MBF4467950.1 sugar O-acetyltransferase [Methanobrevibacter arboriphilus]